MTRPKGICRATRKRKYPDDIEARIALGKIQRSVHREDGRPVPIRVYDCPFCSGWHLTSQPQKK